MGKFVCNARSYYSVGKGVIMREIMVDWKLTYSSSEYINMKTESCLDVKCVVLECFFLG